MLVYYPGNFGYYKAYRNRDKTLSVCQAYAVKQPRNSVVVISCMVR